MQRLLITLLLLLGIPVRSATNNFPGSHWETREADQAGVSQTKLDELSRLVGGRGCVVRHGYMVYSWGDQTKSSDVASAFKPVLSTLLLMAVQEGRLKGPDDLVADFEPRLKTLNGGKDASMTWRHLASQMSGYGLAEAPGAAYSYNDFALTLYYTTLTQKVFQTNGTEVLRSRLAGPLQFEDEFTFQAIRRPDRDGRLGLSVRDFARIGLLYLRNGRWRDQQLLKPEFVRMAINSPIPASTPLTSGREADMLPGQHSIGGGKNITPVGPGYYSFNWWLNRTNAAGQRLYADAPPDAYVASGHGGKRTLWLFPSFDLIVCWNDSPIDDHDKSPGNPDSKCNQAVRLMVQAVAATPATPASSTGNRSVSGGARTNWFADANWYQIFPERFRNGDPANDPVAASLEGTWPYTVPNDWQVVPWTSDWYALQPWEKANGRGFYYNAQLRRYGGDLQGIIDQLDYLRELGVNALYLNPIFESPSLHKYGATMYHHVDKHFGPDPKGDLELFAREDPANPTTWRWSAADQLFLKLLAEAHRRNMRVIIDGVFNHVGIPFWAFQRARREGPDGRFAKWFHIRRWDDPATPRDEFDYQGWIGIKDLPEFAKDARGPHAEVKEHLRAVLQRWMDPNGDGDPSDGVDGWRLDVAAELPLAFWEEFRGWVKAINPDAYLTGEIWWDNFDQFTFRDARPWLDRAFDSVMNYRFGDAVYQFFNQPQPVAASEFRRLLETLQTEFGYGRSLVQQNLFSSHDTSRIGSAVVNPQYRQDHGAGVEHNRNYQVRSPNAGEKQRWRQMVAFQFLAPGAPYLYYGDEVGMWGADDPDCRKPMVWTDRKYEVERAHPFGQTRAADEVSPDLELLKFYRTLAALRREHAALRRGNFAWLVADDARRVVAFRRQLEGEKILAVFNAGNQNQTLALSELQVPPDSRWRDLMNREDAKGAAIEVAAGGFRVLRFE